MNNLNLNLQSSFVFKRIQIPSHNAVQVAVVHVCDDHTDLPETTERR